MGDAQVSRHRVDQQIVVKMGFVSDGLGMAFRKEIGGIDRRAGGEEQFVKRCGLRKVLSGARWMRVTVHAKRRPMLSLTSGLRSQPTSTTNREYAPKPASAPRRTTRSKSTRRKEATQPQTSQEHTQPETGNSITKPTKHLRATSITNRLKMRTPATCSTN